MNLTRGAIGFVWILTELSRSRLICVPIATPFGHFHLQQNTLPTLVTSLLPSFPFSFSLDPSRNHPAQKTFWKEDLPFCIAARTIFEISSGSDVIFVKFSNPASVINKSSSIRTPPT